MAYPHFLMLCRNMERVLAEDAKFSALANHAPKALFKQEERQIVVNHKNKAQIQAIAAEINATMA